MRMLALASLILSAEFKPPHMVAQVDPGKHPSLRQVDQISIDRRLNRILA
jgi:hypothetical protein